MEEEPKITTTTQKVKNPGRVEAGKRLAAISREVKARKAAERKKSEEECIGNSNLFYITVGVLGVAGLWYGVYIFFCKKGRVQVGQPPQPQGSPPPSSSKEAKVILTTYNK